MRLVDEKSSCDQNTFAEEGQESKKPPRCYTQLLFNVNLSNDLADCIANKLDNKLSGSGGGAL
ncbi:hypothetical protein C0995_016291, partial [Termitomyces sp. Mi166